MHKSSNKPEIIHLHKHLIRHKKFLYQFYQDAYQQIKTILGSNKPIIELDSGAGFIKKVIPKTLTSDVIAGPNIDQVFSVENLPFKNNSVGAFVLFSVFHHIKNPEKGLVEMQRCLKKRGKIVMIEPYNSTLSGFIFKNFHQETFDEKAGWAIKGKGRLTNANLALPWIVFIRDRELFQNRFPRMIINRVSPHTPIKYILSGGLSYDWSTPAIFYKLITLTEFFLTPFNKYLAMFVTIELEKK